MLWSNALFGNWQRPVYIAFMYKTIGNGKCLLLEIKKPAHLGPACIMQWDCWVRT